MRLHLDRGPLSPRSRDRGDAGYTLIELFIALVLGLVVVLAIGKLLIANQRSWEWGRDKVVLQQNTTEVLEWMSRSIRSARTLAVVDSTELRTFDEGGALVKTYDTAATGGQIRLRENGVPLIDRQCTRFVVVPDADTTSVTVIVELEDRAGSRVEAMTRVAIRNDSFEF
jgi:type II secretory pathway component PulJ